MQRARVAFKEATGFLAKSKNVKRQKLASEIMEDAVHEVRKDTSWVLNDSITYYKQLKTRNGI